LLLLLLYSKLQLHFPSSDYAKLLETLAQTHTHIHTKKLSTSFFPITVMTAKIVLTASSFSFGANNAQRNGKINQTTMANVEEEFHRRHHIYDMLPDTSLDGKGRRTR